MPNYKKMYLTLVGEVSNTIDSLIAALHKSEDIYLNSDEPDIKIIRLREDKEKQPPTD